MIRNGIEGAETCAEIFEPHYRNSFHMEAVKCLEAAIVENKGVEQIEEALTAYSSMVYVSVINFELNRAPQEVKDLNSCMRDAARDLIKKAAGNPAAIVSPKY